MHIDFLLDVFSKNRKEEAIIWKGEHFDYEWLLDRINYWKNEIQKEHITVGTVVVLEADFSPAALALLLGLIDAGCIIVPLTSSVELQKSEFIKIAEGEVVFKVDRNDHLEISKTYCQPAHALISQLKEVGHPGLSFIFFRLHRKKQGVVKQFFRYFEQIQGS